VALRCSFALSESHPEGWSLEVWVSFVGDRSRSNTRVDEEEGGWEGIGTAKHCRDGVVALDENVWLMIAWLRSKGVGEGENLDISRKRQMNISQLERIISILTEYRT
jgi:hypothetical protein